MSRLEHAAVACASALLPRDDGGAAFAEPWQAQAFALAVSLSANGHFTWQEWAAELGAELALATRSGAVDDASTYYECWLAALERLTAAKRLATRSELRERAAVWAEASRATPHGEPVIPDFAPRVRRRPG